MAANGISTLPTKEDRQKAKLTLAAVNRVADGYLATDYDISQLPTQYVGNSVVNNLNIGGLQEGRPWITNVNPLTTLFSAGEQGLFYDPSDFSTLFQDAAGLTPVTAVEQPVGLVLDKSKNGVGTNGAKRINLMSYTESIGGTSWNVSNITINPTPTAAPDGRLVATSVNVTNFSSNFLTQQVSTISNTQYKISFWVKRGTLSSYRMSVYAPNAGVFILSGFNYTASTVAGTWVKIETTVTTPAVNGTSMIVQILRDTQGTGTAEFAFPDVRLATETSGYQPIPGANWRVSIPGNHAYQSASNQQRPILSARVNLLTDTETLATQSVTTRATTQKLTFSGTGSITLSGTATGTYTAGTYIFTTTAGTLTLTVAGTVTKADLRALNMDANIPSYQRVNSGTDYTTSGFPYYLRFDGVDDWLTTDSIDFGTTDKITVWAGIRKLKRESGNRAMLVELGTTIASTGTFNILAPETNVPIQQYSFGLNGTSQQYRGVSDSNFNSPISNVIFVKYDISKTSLDQEITFRINGTLPNNIFSSGTAGTGNFRNASLFIGRRSASSSTSFEGNLYSLIIRGTDSTNQQIEDIEVYVNRKTKAF